MELTDLSLDRDMTVIAFMDQEAKIVYRPALITLNRLADVMKNTQDEEIDGLVNFLVDVISEWDLTRNGEPLPITEDVISNLPAPLIQSIFKGIQTASSNLGEARGRSTNSSRSTGRRGSFQDGTA